MMLYTTDITILSYNFFFTEQKNEPKPCPARAEKKYMLNTNKQDPGKARQNV